MIVVTKKTKRQKDKKTKKEKNTKRQKDKQDKQDKKDKKDKKTKKGLKRQKRQRQTPSTGARTRGPVAPKVLLLYFLQFYFFFLFFSILSGWFPVLRWKSCFYWCYNDILHIFIVTNFLPDIPLSSEQKRSLERKHHKTYNGFHYTLFIPAGQRKVEFREFLRHLLPSRLRQL